MNRAQKIGWILMGVSVVSPLIIEYIVEKYENRKPKVDFALQKEIAADRHAKAIVKETIHNGDGYEDRLVSPAEDFEFYRLAYHFEN
jgi:hypothetical protein